MFRERKRDSCFFSLTCGISEFRCRRGEGRRDAIYVGKQSYSKKREITLISEVQKGTGSPKVVGKTSGKKSFS